MDHSLKTGITFGMTSGTITTVGLMVGLHSGTHSRLAVLVGIITIAIADAFSDGMGIHLSEESENRHSRKEIWLATLTTFLTKFLFALSFVIPVLVFELNTAIIVSVTWAMVILTALSLMIAAEKGARKFNVVVEHLAIAGAVVLITHFVGDFVGKSFN